MAGPGIHPSGMDRVISRIEGTNPLSMTILHIVRGPSGCGKTTFAKTFITEWEQWEEGSPPVIIAADDFFTSKDGTYEFDPRLLSRAHTECITNTMIEMHMERDIVITNTFANRWEYNPYVWLAKTGGVECIIYEPDIMHDPFDGMIERMEKRGTHDVPLETIANQVENFHFAEPWKLVSEVKIYETGLL